MVNIWLLVTGTMEFHDFPLGIIIPTDEVIFCRGVGQPPTKRKSCIIIFLDPFSAGTLDFQYLFLSFPLSSGHGLRPEGPEWW